MVVVAQLVRAPDCGSGGRRFETDLPPSRDSFESLFFIGNNQLFHFMSLTLGAKYILTLTRLLK